VSHQAPGPKTFAGLSGLGDLIVTCTSRLSRNHLVGERLGRGETLDQIVASMSQVAEGVTNCAIVRALARERGVRTPITDEVHAMLHEGRSPARPCKRSCYAMPARRGINNRVFPIYDLKPLLYALTPIRIIRPVRHQVRDRPRRRTARHSDNAHGPYHGQPAFAAGSDVPGYSRRHRVWGLSERARFISSWAFLIWPPEASTTPRARVCLGTSAILLE